MTTTSNYIIDTEEKAYLYGLLYTDLSKVYSSSKNLKQHIEKIEEKISSLSLQLLEGSSQPGFFGTNDELKNNFSNLKNKLKCSFIRGYFESNGKLLNIFAGIKKIEPEIQLKFDSPELLNEFKQYCDIKYYQIDNILHFKGTNALDFLSKIYDYSSSEFRLDDMYQSYLNWISYPQLSISHLPFCSFVKADSKAVIPFKNRASDIGYDLTIISKVKEIGSRTVLYDTGIKIMPQYGYYIKLVPRSSIIKSGYILSNSIGIIDPTFRSTLKVPLTKIDDKLPDIELPFTCCQLILEKAIHFEMVEVKDENEFESTSRGEGGFGSTDNLKKN